MARQTRKQKRTLDVRSINQINKFNNLASQAPFTLVLIYADWCPHCHEYLPIWDEFANLPGRNANMAKVHFDMQEKIPNIANAKINGYPSVIKVLPDGTVEQYKDESGEATNALPNMRDKNEMIKNLMIKPVSANKLFGKTMSNKVKRNWNSLKNANNVNNAEAKAEEAKAAENVEAEEKNEEEEKNVEAEEKNEEEEKNIEEEETAKKEKAVKNGIKNVKNKKDKNINFPGIITSKDIMDTEKALLQEGGRRRRKIQSFLKGGSLLEELRLIGGYLKK